jgi:hypothetical protein
MGVLASPARVTDTTISAHPGGHAAPGSRARTRGPFLDLLSRHRWWVVAVVLVLVSIAFVVATRMRPEYDAYGWLVWGRQALHGNLNTDGAPSWKPLTFLFTFPYALAGQGQPFLWMVTAVAGALAGSVFAARLAYRLTGPCPERRYAPYIAGAFAGLGLLGISTYWRLILISNSDLMVVSLCLGAIDFHLSERPRVAFACLVLASFGRPEAWFFTALYAVWAWRAHPKSRPLLVGGLVLIPALWFGVSALTAKSWFRAGDLALNSVNVIHGNKITGVIGRLFGLYEAPMWIAAAIGLGFAIARRQRAVVVMAIAAVAWVIIEIGLALHGWSAVPRYLIEPGAVMVVIAGIGVGRLVALAPDGAPALRWVGPVLALILLGTLLPAGRDRARIARDEVENRRAAGTQIDRLHAVIDRDGGPSKILACGQPVSVVGFQSTLAWEVGLNVGNVGYRPGRSIDSGKPIVLFKPNGLGWHVRPIHTSVACAALKADTATG